MKDNFEIERKFLIEFPRAELLEMAEKSDIEQVYLSSGAKGLSERVRKRVFADRCEYTHTSKKRLNDMKRIEIEEIVSEVEYNELLLRRDPDRSIILKQRYCIPYCGHTLELDVFPFWKDRAVMEIELSAEDETFEIISGISVIKEITTDKRYTNASMARSIPYDDI